MDGARTCSVTHAIHALFHWTFVALLVVALVVAGLVLLAVQLVRWLFGPK